MPDALDPRSVIEQAERAAGAGDYLAAERLLREAASQQETALGPFHPDLVNTLNNLAVVYETIDQPADAERCYRRAYSIAMTSLAPDHPFVETSEKNFRDFCSSRGIPFEPPTPVPSVESTPVVPAPVVPEVRAVEAPVASLPDASPYVAPPTAIDTTPSRSPSFAVLAVAGLVLIVAAGLWLGRSGSSEPAPVESQQSPAPSPPPETPAPAPAREAVVAAPVEPPAPEIKPAPAPESKPAARPAVESKQPVASPRAKPAAAASANATVEDAGLCTELSTREWRCTPASKEIDPGQLFFYTRVKSPESLTVEHRWYWGDRLYRTVSLYVQSNERAGFRTYSRTAVKPGNWRVELRAKGGPVLHQEAFIVR